MEKPFILTVGLPGTGKRTISRHLAAKLGYRRFNTDEARRDLGLADYDPADTEKVFQHISDRVQAAFLQGEGAIFHTAYKTSNARQGAYEFARAFDRSTLVIECQCPEAIAKSRILARPPKDHLNTPPNDPAVWDKLKLIWQEVAPEISATQNPDVSHIIYQSDQSLVRPITVRDIHVDLVARITALLAELPI